MAGRERLISLVVAMATLGSLAGCGGKPKAKPGSQSGYAIGYDRTGVFYVCLADGQTALLLPQQEGHTWTDPVFDPRSSTLYCVDSQTETIISWKHGDGKPTVIFTAPAHSRVESLSLRPDGGELVYRQF